MFLRKFYVFARLPKSKSINKSKFQNNNQNLNFNLNIINPNKSFNSNSFTQVNKLNLIPTPLNEKQKLYIEKLQDINPSIVIATGPAGSSKSFLAVSMGINELINNKYKKIIITRPTISVDEDLGYLPGNINNKMDPWLRPLYDTFYKYYSVKEVKSMIDSQIIDICPISYLRGRTLENSFIIVDEAQNCSVNQILMILTRIGYKSKMVLTGDLMQHDRGKNQINGLGDLINRIEKSDEPINDISHIKFTHENVVRHPVIKDILNLYQ